jgi:hypothetical protein
MVKFDFYYISLKVDYFGHFRLILTISHPFSVENEEIVYLCNIFCTYIRQVAYPTGFSFFLDPFKQIYAAI